MSYRGLVLILIALIIVFIARISFEQSTAGGYLSKLIAFFISPFFLNETGPFFKSVPFYQMNHTAIMAFIGVSALLCTLANIFEVIQINTMGKNSLSAGVISLSICILLLNIQLWHWNS